MAQNMAYVGECFNSHLKKCVFYCVGYRLIHMSITSCWLMVDPVVEFFYILVDFVY